MRPYFLWLFAVSLSAQPTQPLTTAATQASEPLATIEGQVTGSLEIPIEGARVSLMPYGRLEVRQSAVTKGLGEYKIADVRPGTYMVMVEKDGYPSMFYGAKAPGRLPDRQLTIKAGQKFTGIDVRLAVGGSIAGLVTDATGKPVPFASVSLLRIWSDGLYRRALPSGGASADEHGRYRLPSLMADTYYVAAVPRSRDTSPGNEGSVRGPTSGGLAYYPSQATLAGAVPIVLSEGAALDAIDIRLRDVECYSIQGRIEMGRGMDVSLWPSGVSVWSVVPRTAEIRTADGEFRFGSVEPGEYELLATESMGSMYVREHVVVVDHDITEMRLAAKPSSSVIGQFVVDGPQKPSLNALLVDLSPGEMLPMWPMNARSSGTGRFEIRRVVPGKYAVNIPTLPEGAVRKKIRWGDFDLSIPVIDVLPDESRVLEVTIALEGGAVAGIVRGSADQPIADATVVTVPDGHGESGEMYATRTDGSGLFLEQSLPLGPYLVIAFEDIDPRKLTRAEIARFERYGERVVVRLGQRSSVPLKVIPKQ